MTIETYKNMYYFLKPDKSLRIVYSVFAFTESYIEEVIEAKNDYETINDVYPEDYETIRYALNRIIRALICLHLIRKRSERS